jgi:tRNA modification GTPase
LNPLILNNDTIAAVATPPGAGAISVIRISGSRAIEAVDMIFKKISGSATHTIHHGKIIDNDNRLIDDVLISVFLAPNSYTGEDSIEISTHGNPFIAQKIIELLLNNGIRAAEPGEFTKRAFLNGKMDLAQAEAVVEVINSRTDASLRGARNQLDGLLSAKVNELRNMLINISSLIELELDFAEEDLELISIKEVLNKINEAVTEIENLLGTYSFGRVIRDGINVAIAGATNVGKSSLLNYLLKESRAIVSVIPGTTRDIIREELVIDGMLFKLFDTAGIRATEDIIEKEGVSRSLNAVKDADIVLCMNDVQTGINHDLLNEILKLTSRDKVLIVVNKVDLSDKKFEEAEVSISAKTGAGIKNLLSKLREMAIGGQNYSEKTAIVSNLRHYTSLKKAVESLHNAEESVKNKLSGEFISIDLRNAEASLGEIIGTITSEDILNNIFSKFCIGK